MKNSKGEVFYGLHMYPGVAEYRPDGDSMYRVYLNSDTIRSMDPTFQGCPVYVFHVDDIPESIDEIRQEADGWVIESFYNKADGKHWAKFVVVSERGLKAIDDGFSLSNCYVPKGSYSAGGMWNGVDYDKEILAAEYHHLAIVPDPRYEESVILTPDQFKEYNAEKLSALEKLSNEKEPSGMKLNFFRREKIDNSADIEKLVVVLPKSKREVGVAKLISEADEYELVKNEGHKVKVGDSEMTVNELVEKYEAVLNELAEMKAANEADKEENEADEDDDKETNEADAEEKEENEADDDKEENEADKEEKEHNSLAKAKSDKLKNAESMAAKLEVETVSISINQVERGKARYGS